MFNQLVSEVRDWSAPLRRVAMQRVGPRVSRRVPATRYHLFTWKVGRGEQEGGVGRGGAKECHVM